MAHEATDRSQDVDQQRAAPNETDPPQATAVASVSAQEAAVQEQPDAGGSNLAEQHKADPGADARHRAFVESYSGDSPPELDGTDSSPQLEQQVAPCQAEIDKGDLAQAKTCWTSRDWTGAPTGFAVSTVISCLDAIPTQQQRLTSCLALPQKTPEQAKAKSKCINDYSATALRRCGPLDVNGIVLRYEGTLGMARVQAELAARVDADDKATRAADEKQLKKCGGKNVLQLVVAMQYRGYDPTKATGCEYQAFLVVVNRTRDGWIIADTSGGGDDGRLMLAAIKAPRRFANGSMIRGRVRLLGVRDFEMTNGKMASIPTFQLLSQ